MLASVRMALRQVCRSTFLLDDALKRLGHGLGLVPIHDADHCVLRVDIDDAQDVPVLSRLTSLLAMTHPCDIAHRSGLKHFFFVASDGRMELCM